MWQKFVEIPFTGFWDGGVQKVFGTHRQTHVITHGRTDPNTVCLRYRFSTVAEAWKYSTSAVKNGSVKNNILNDYTEITRRQHVVRTQPGNNTITCQVIQVTTGVQTDREQWRWTSSWRCYRQRRLRGIRRNADLPWTVDLNEPANRSSEQSDTGLCRQTNARVATLDR